MRRARRRWRPPLAVAGAALAATCLAACATSGAGRDAPSVLRSAHPVHPTATASVATGVGAHSRPEPGAAVGALFTGGLAQPHSCTATVVASARGDVVMTAAHCVSGTGTGLTFVPGYDAGATPFGVWAVTGAYAPTGWLAGADEDDDVAFLTVAPQSRGGAVVTVQQVTGAVTLESGVSDGERVTVIAYDDGIDDAPVRCTAPVRDTVDHPTIDCHGFVAGSSGSAWTLVRGGTTVAVGLIGGHQQGGCEEQTSYSPTLGPDVTAALAAAGRGDAPQTLPNPPDDGC